MSITRERREISVEDRGHSSVQGAKCWDIWCLGWVRRKGAAAQRAEPDRTGNQRGESLHKLQG